MGFVERHLMPGEALMYRARLHWALLLPHLLWLGLFGAALIATSVTVRGFWPYIPLVLLVFSVIRALAAYVMFNTVEFGVTTHRVIVKRGLFTLRSTEILLQKVEAIQVEQSIWGRVLNFGTVLIVGTGGTRESFDMVEGPYELRNAVQSQLVGQGKG